MFDNTTFMLCSNKVRGKYYAKIISCIDRKQTAGYFQN